MQKHPRVISESAAASTVEVTWVFERMPRMSYSLTMLGRSALGGDLSSKVTAMPSEARTSRAPGWMPSRRSARRGLW
jgi:hypothetical protein